MKKKIAILGSTSSIGKSLLNIIKKENDNNIKIKFIFKITDPKTNEIGIIKIKYLNILKAINELYIYFKLY